MAPWIALAIKPNGDIGPDAQSTLVYGNIIHETFEEILNSENYRNLKKSFSAGKFGEGCLNCEKKEISLGHSRRIFFEHTLRRFNLQLSQKAFSSHDFQYLDINFSNKCNLKCRMCNSESSTLWIKEDRQLVSKFGDQLNRPREPKAEKVEIETVMKLFKNPQFFKNLKYIALRGGEPLLEIENVKVLEKMVEWGIADQVTLDISTNGTVISKPLLELMSHFKQVDFYVSVEGAGELYQYIRGGDKFSIENLEENVRQYRQVANLTVMFTVAVSIYNIFKLDELWSWFDRFYKPFDEISMSNVVVRPDYLNFQILPQEMKQEALKRLNASSILEGPHHTGRRLIGDSGKQLIRASLQKEIFNQHQKELLIEKFCLFNSEVDITRKSQLLNYVPELSPLFDVKKRGQMLSRDSNHTFL